MRITRHVAPDMRQALRLVREQLGPDAVILTSRKVAEGVEVTAAMDFNAETLSASPPPPPQPAPAATPRAATKPVGYSTTNTAFTAAAERSRIEPDSFEAALAAASSEASLPDLDEEKAESPVDAMSRELKTLRRMLETQLAQLAWNDLSRRSPVQTEILRELTEIGLAHDTAAEVASQLPAGCDLTTARRITIATLSQRVMVTGDRWLDEGGKVAFVGPTGVGKTTTLAKLAVRWVLRHGPRDLALVAADCGRIGAQEQIQTLGQLLGVPVYRADGVTELPTLLSRLSRHRCVLIDTQGLSQRDSQLAERLQTLSDIGPQLETALVLSASTQAGAIEETLKRFATANPASAVLTKVDEAASLGGVLSALIRARLPVSYLSEGQRVPEDLRPARALELVSSAVRLAKASGAAADEDLLRRRFGEVAHVLA